jgi:Cd2+/Zn2+-exporting ATPase/Cu+-exporting ATPase
VLTGHSFIDESRITGESMPVEKLPGARVYAGTINQSGALEIRAEQIGRDTSYGRILDAVERAEKSRAPVQRLADKLAAYIVYVALAFAAFEYWITGGDVTSTIAVIVVAGACGVAAGTPLASLGGIGRAAKLGAIIKGGVHLEVLGKVDTVVLDKTGTLTFGKPEVSALIPEPGVNAQDLLAAAATAEVLSEHPLGKAVMAYSAQQGHQTDEPQHFDYTPGRGILATTAAGDVLVGNVAWLQENGIAANPSGQHSGSEIFVARDGRLLGRIIVEDTIRPEAKRAIDDLRKLGIRTVLLTGDAPEIAQRVAEELGIDAFEAQLLPEDKLNRVQRLVSSRRVVAMVGDGINDAPALAAASVGVAMGSGTEVAREKADIVLLGNDLAKFAETCRVAQRTRAIIWFNFVGTVLVDVTGIAMAFAGWIGPFEAAAIHTASELAFILNSARLLPNAVFWKRPDVSLPTASEPVVARAQV